MSLAISMDQFDGEPPRDPRQPVSVFALPDNHRDARDEDEASCATLPIPMPRCIVAIVGDDGTPVYINADGQRIRRKDLMTVWTAVQQFNDDLSGYAVHPMSASALEGLEDDEGDEGVAEPGAR